MRTVFMGTPDFSATVLNKLCESGYVPSLVETSSDNPAGRGNALKQSAVKVLALEKGIEIAQPEKLSDEAFQSKLREIAPELIIVVAYGRILPESVLSLPKYGCINAHASLLPKYRGAAPMQRAIMDGESETGVTVMKMDKGLDTGDMILTVKTPITDTDDLESIHDRLADISGDALIEAIKQIENGTAVYTPQDSEKATYAEKILKDDEPIDFSLSAKSVSCKIRALYPFPNAYAKFNGKLLKILSARVIDDADLTDKAPGEVLSLKNGEITVACGSGALAISRVFPESKRRMDSKDFINGSKIKVGDILN